MTEKQQRQHAKRNAQLPEGYKQTEVGMIPEDWEVKTVSEFAQTKTGPFGTLLKASEYSDNNGVPLISVREIGIGNIKVTENTPFVPNAVIRRLPQYLLREGDIVFGRKGAVERSALVTEDEDGWFLGSDGISVRPQHECYPQYIAYQFQRYDVQAWLLQNATGTTMASLNQAILGRVQIPYAPLPEQRAIAAALNDVDALLNGLNRLIAKKRDLKQAATQQLLSGQTRLPGFEGKWEVKRLGEHVKFLRNGVNSRAELTLDEPVKYLHYGDIHACAGVTLNPITLPSLPANKTKTLDRLRDGDLIFVDASEDIDGVSKSVEIYGVSNIECVSGLHTIAARFDKEILVDGFKAYLQFCPAFSSQLRRLAAGTKVYATNRAHISSVEMRLPGIKEQVAIASILNDMDAEIAALEQRRHKTKNLKQAMMQELLTGKTRLISPEGASDA